MKIIVAAIGQRMPDWVNKGWHEYAKRMPRECPLILKELKQEARTSGKTSEQMMQLEAQRLLSAVTPNSVTIALDEHGTDISTLDLSKDLTRYRDTGHNIVFFIGGPDGLDNNLKQEAHKKYRLSSMTMAHPLVRVVLAEQIYRAWSIMNNHPYHRA